VHFQRAVKAEPLLIRPSINLGIAYEQSGNFSKAQAEFERCRDLIGDKQMVDASYLGLAMEMEDRDKIESLSGKYIDEDPLSPGSKFVSTMRSHLDRPEQARIELRRIYNDAMLNSFPNSFLFKKWVAYFGDDALALQIFQKNLGPYTALEMWHPIYKEMRRLSGFKDLVRDLGLVDYWRAAGNWGEFCRPLGEDDFECK